MRILSLIGCLFLFACTSTQARQQAAQYRTYTAIDGTPCIKDRAALLALDQAAFDQDLRGGWRKVSQRAGCELAASDLLRDYRNQKLAAGDKKGLNILYWHEGQMRATVGETDAALDLFRQTYKQSQSWNYYVDGTIAFLEDDRPTLLAARDALAALPEPDYWDEMVKNTQEEFGFSPKWPNNLNVLEGFVSCFGEPYAKAYGDCGEGFLVTPKATETG